MLSMAPLAFYGSWPSMVMMKSPTERRQPNGQGYNHNHGVNTPSVPLASLYPPGEPQRVRAHCAQEVLGFLSYSADTPSVLRAGEKPPRRTLGAHTQYARKLQEDGRE
jgi:hypothetical protein